MTNETISVEFRGQVLLIGLNRPDKMNAFNLQLLRELAAAYGEYERNPDFRCALLHAHGDHFTAGLDLAEVGPAVAQGETLFPQDSIDPLDLQEPRRTKPVVCAVQGYCFTIGMELLLASDIRMAAENTVFAQMEVSRGIMPFGGATIRLPQIAGWGNAMRYLLTGERFDAAEGYRIGLIQEVLPPDQLAERALAMAQLVADQAPLAVRQTRLASRKAMEQGRQAALETLVDKARQLMHTADAREGVMSFLERRKAVFAGK
jgi:enoyl-CoA hydratase/carnithine racemase